MRRQIFTSVMAIALAAGMTTGAMAFDPTAGHGGHRVKAFRAGGTHGFARRSNRFAGDRDPVDRGGFIDLGPLGITMACGSYRHQPGYCGSGYSVSAWSY